MIAQTGSSTGSTVTVIDPVFGDTIQIGNIRKPFITYYESERVFCQTIPTAVRSAKIKKEGKRALISEAGCFDRERKLHETIQLQNYTIWKVGQELDSIQVKSNTLVKQGIQNVDVVIEEKKGQFWRSLWKGTKRASGYAAVALGAYFIGDSGIFDTTTYK